MIIITKLERLYEKYIERKWKHYKKMERKYHNINDMYWCVLKSEKNFDVPFIKRLKMYKNGFNSDEYIKYNFNQNDMCNYITEKERWDSRHINGEYNIILDDKEIFYYIFKDFVKTPKIIGRVDEGKITCDDKNISIDELLQMLKKVPGLVFRVNRNGGGRGLFILKLKKQKYELNGKIVKRKDIDNFINSGNYIITEALENAKYSANIYDKSVNTLRIVIAKEKNSQTYEVIATYHRFGCDESIPGDNVCRGGLISKIDMKTGKLGKATKAKEDIFYSKHPDTGSQIEGVIVPNFELIKQQLLDLAYKFPFLNFIAWDVVVTDTGFEIIEGNTSSDINMFQYFGGLRKEKLGEIYKSYNILQK